MSIAPVKGVSLRALLWRTFALFATLFVGAAGALALVTTYLHRSERDLGLAMDTTHAAQELELQLAAYYRHGLSGAPDVTAPPSEVEVRRSMKDVVGYASDPNEHDLVNRVREHVEAYLGSQRTGGNRGLSPAEVAATGKQRLDRAFSAIDSLVEHNVEHSRTFRESASREAAIADALSASVGVLGILALTVVMAIFRQQISVPLQALETAIARFARGEHDTRAPEAGPAELRRIGSVFNEMADNLATREQRQRVFLAGIAHDLRNPLCAMQMSIRAALKPAADRDDRLRHALPMVDRQIGRMSRMLDDFLDAARIEAGELELRFGVRDLRDLVIESVELYRPFSMSHSFEVHVPNAAVWIHCDATRIGQVVNNLLSNAVKYSPEGGLVSIALTQHKGDAELTVSDEGLGIEAADLSRIFEPFRRTSVSRALLPGVGLGLSVARRIVERHSGRIEVQSQPGRGTTFCICLPIVSTMAPIAHRGNVDSFQSYPAG